MVGGGTLVPHIVPWDPTIIQSFGGDRTILGDEDDELVDQVNNLINSDSNMDDSDTGFGNRMVLQW